MTALPRRSAAQAGATFSGSTRAPRVVLDTPSKAPARAIARVPTLVPVGREARATTCGAQVMPVRKDRFCLPIIMALGIA